MARVAPEGKPCQATPSRELTTSSYLIAEIGSQTCSVGKSKIFFHVYLTYSHVIKSKAAFGEAYVAPRGFDFP